MSDIHVPFGQFKPEYKYRNTRKKYTTYSTEAGGSRGAGRSRKSGLAGDTIVTSGTSRTLEGERERKKEGVRLKGRNKRVT